MVFGSVFPDALAKHPYLKVIFGYSPIVYFALIMVRFVAWFLKSTRGGLILRAVGENDLSAHSIGYSVIGVRYAAIAFGGAMAGIGGAYFSMVITRCGREDDRRPRLDCAGAGGVCRWRHRPAAGRGLFLRDPDGARALCQGPPASRSCRPSSGQRCPIS